MTVVKPTVGSIGVKIILNVESSVAAATLLEILFRKPDGSVGTWTAVKEADNTHISYTTTTVDDLDVAGEWLLWSYVEMPGWSGPGELAEMIVGDAPETEELTLTVGTNTWATLVEAELYFKGRIGAAAQWAECFKPAALISAFNYLYYSGRYTFPETPTQAIKIAQCEMALFLLQHQADMDARKGIQSQGVVQAGIVQETYDKDAVGEIPIPAIVKNILSAFENGSPLLAANVERDDEEDA